MLLRDRAELSGWFGISILVVAGYAILQMTLLVGRVEAERYPVGRSEPVHVVNATNDIRNGIPLSRSLSTPSGYRDECLLFWSERLRAAFRGSLVYEILCHSNTGTVQNSKALTHVYHDVASYGFSDVLSADTILPISGKRAIWLTGTNDLNLANYDPRPIIVPTIVLGLVNRGMRRIGASHRLDSLDQIEERDQDNESKGYTLNLIAFPLSGCAITAGGYVLVFYVGRKLCFNLSRNPDSAGYLALLLAAILNTWGGITLIAWRLASAHGYTLLC